MPADSPTARSPLHAPARAHSWGYAIGSGVLCGVGAAALTAFAVASVYFVDHLGASTSDGPWSQFTEALSWASPVFFLGGMIATFVSIPAGAVLGAVNNALVRSAPPTVALALALVLAALAGAVLPLVVLEAETWLAATSATCAGIAAEVQVHLLLRRSRPGRR